MSDLMFPISNVTQCVSLTGFAATRASSVHGSAPCGRLPARPLQLRVPPPVRPAPLRGVSLGRVGIPSVVWVSSLVWRFQGVVRHFCRVPFVHSSHERAVFSPSIGRSPLPCFVSRWTVKHCTLSTQVSISFFLSTSNFNSKVVRPHRRLHCEAHLRGGHHVRPDLHRRGLASSSRGHPCGGAVQRRGSTLAALFGVFFR